MKPGTGEQITRAALARRLGESVQKCCDDRQPDRIHDTLQSVIKDDFIGQYCFKLEMNSKGNLTLLSIGPLTLRQDLPANAGAIVMTLEEDGHETTGPYG